MRRCPASCVGPRISTQLGNHLLCLPRNSIPINSFTTLRMQRILRYHSYDSTAKMWGRTRPAAWARQTDGPSARSGVRTRGRYRAAAALDQGQRPGHLPSPGLQPGDSATVDVLSGPTARPFVTPTLQRPGSPPWWRSLASRRYDTVLTPKLPLSNQPPPSNAAVHVPFAETRSMTHRRRG